jgi:peptidoglycan/xylan/chitin deacetylase (PgdA/CDA1 family)
MVAAHTWDHKDLTKLSRSQIVTEFSKIETALQRILGVKPAFMRPPYGSYNNLVREVAYERGQKVVLWDFDSGDSTGSTASQSNKAYDALIKKHPSTILALNHEVYSTSTYFYGESCCGYLLIILWLILSESTAYTVLPHAIKALQKAGYKLVTVAECRGKQPYQSVSAPQSVRLVYSRTIPVY